MARTHTTLSAPLQTPLPREFRIFRAGKNETTKGTFVFDAEAARSVLAAYAREGVDMMIDLNHESLQGAARPDSGDARGWAKLELRPDGSLWAVNVRWTPDGERRLQDRTQRYISPAFEYDKDTGRITRVLNAALVAMPATHGAAPLVAASRYGAKTSRVVSARLARATFERVRRAAASRRMTTGHFVRLAIEALAQGKADPSRIVADLAVALGLARDAAPLDVLAAFKSLVDALDAPPDGADAAGGTGESADAPAAPLSRAALAACKAKGITPAELIARKAAVARRRA
jgi:hypothetical protein